MQDKRNLQDLYKQEDRLLASTNEPTLRPVKRLVERLTSDYVPDKFVNPSIFDLEKSNLAKFRSTRSLSNDRVFSTPI